MFSIRSAEQIQSLLQSNLNNGYIVKKTLLREATIESLLEALSKYDEVSIRAIICDVLGQKRARGAVPILISLLDDDCSNIRSVAAESLAKIGDVKAGPFLLERFAKEQELGVKRMYTAALGAVMYLPAVATLVQALLDADSSLRGSAAWSLGRLKNTTAVSPLEQALQRETDAYARQRMQEALETLQKIDN